MSRVLEKLLILILFALSFLLAVFLVGFMDYNGLIQLRQYLPERVKNYPPVHEYFKNADRNALSPKDRQAALLEERENYIEKLLGEMKVESRKLLEEKERLEGLFRELEEERRQFDGEKQTYREKVEKYEKARAARESEEFQARLDGLAQMYSKMDPAKAAGILDTMSMEMSKEVLKRLKPKVLGQILENLKSDRAAEFINMLQTPVKPQMPDFLAKGS